MKGLVRLILLLCIIGTSVGTMGATREKPESARKVLEVSASVVRVLGVTGGGWGRQTRLLLRVDGRPQEPLVVWQDQAAIRCVEDANEILFDDFVGRPPGDRPIRVVLRGYRRADHDPGGLPYPCIAHVTALNPRAGQQKDCTDVPVVTAPPLDFWHRYLEVPVSYAHPGYGRFRLYYEINHDFDPTRPTLMFPADAQQTGSWIGWADRTKKAYKLSCNVVTYQYRSTFPSSIPQLFDRHGRIDWEMAWHALNIDNAIEDMDRIRADLLGPDGQMDLYGGSGIAVLSLAYLARYHRHVRRAFLMSFFHDARGGSEAGVAFFERFLEKSRLKKAFARALEEPGIKPTQLYWVLQRLLYSDQPKARQLIEQASRGDFSVYNEESARTGSVDYEIRSTQINWPQTVVFMYETNVPTSAPGAHDVNEPFFRMGDPIARLAKAGRIAGRRLDIRGLDKVSTEVLVVSGSLDQVTPVEEQTKVSRLLPQARQVVVKGYHCLEDQRSYRSALLRAFLRYGSASENFEPVLRDPRWRDVFVKLR